MAPNRPIFCTWGKKKGRKEKREKGKKRGEKVRRGKESGKRVRGLRRVKRERRRKNGAQLAPTRSTI